MHAAHGPAAVAGAPATRTVRAARAARTALTAAGVSLVAAWVHLAYMPSHFREWWAEGAFFLAVGAFQAALAVLLLRRPGTWILLAGIAGNLAVIGMYVLSRTVGAPLGPHAGVPEDAGTIDLATTAGEVCLVGLLLGLLDGATRRRAANVLLALGVLLWALRLTNRLP
jgi:hypothetical protein